MFVSQRINIYVVTQAFQVNSDGTLERVNHEFKLPSDRYFLSALNLITCCKMLALVIYVEILLCQEAWSRKD